MKNEKLQKWALIAEIIGGIAVVFSLIFVGLEVRQSSEETALNTRAIEVNAYQDLISQILSLNYQFLGEPELSELWASVGDCEPIENRADREQISRYIASVLRHGDMAFHQFEQGLISEERLDNALGILTQHIRDDWPIWELWERGKERGALHIPFQEYVDELVLARGGKGHPCPNLRTDG